MSKFYHRLYIVLLSLVIIASLFFLFWQGTEYYNVSIEERYFHNDHQFLKPSGIMGHGLGIIGSFLILIGVSSYMLRKRYRPLFRFGSVKHWLEFHIFLCTLGPILILFHTAFKFGGLVAISFWSMVAVFASGVIGRFIYIQIPRTIEGRELSLSEVREIKDNIDDLLTKDHQIPDNVVAEIRDTIKDRIKPQGKFILFESINNYFENKRKVSKVNLLLKRNKFLLNERKKILQLIKKDITLSRRIKRLQQMQNLFKYWHVAHLPFAFVMLIIMIIHVVVTIRFGYRWIF